MVHSVVLSVVPLKNGDETIASLYERILGRVSVHDVINPTTGDIIVAAGEEIQRQRHKLLRFTN